MDGKQFHMRIWVVRVLLAAILAGFFLVLWNLQVVNGAYYRSQSVRKIVYTETVEAARGEILDRYGRVLVTNSVQYNVTLDTTLMGEERNEILSSLLALCREHGVEWTDSLPVSNSAPWI